MTRAASALFNNLLGSVDQLEVVAAELETQQRTDLAATVRRSGWVLGVAAFDTFMHELGIQLLLSRCVVGSVEAADVANYVKSVSAATLQGPSAEAHLRLRLSYKTLVAPRSIDSLLTASGFDAQDVWTAIALDLTTRPDRLKMLTEFIFDRRNQIAHEGDWDVSNYDFRPMEAANLRDCLTHLIALTGGFARRFATT